jgi:hypothetical protein
MECRSPAALWMWECNVGTQREQEVEEIEMNGGRYDKRDNDECGKGEQDKENCELLFAIQCEHGWHFLSGMRVASEGR